MGEHLMGEEQGVGTEVHLVDRRGQELASACAAVGLPASRADWRIMNSSRASSSGAEADGSRTASSSTNPPQVVVDRRELEAEPPRQREVPVDDGGVGHHAGQVVTEPLARTVAEIGWAQLGGGLGDVEGHSAPQTG